MRFWIIVLASFSMLILSSVLLLPRIFTHLKNSPEINYYINHPDSSYAIFSRCKLHVDDGDICYNAYSAAVSLADSKDCSVRGIATKRRFKKLVGYGSEKKINETIISECSFLHNN